MIKPYNSVVSVLNNTKGVVLFLEEEISKLNLLSVDDCCTNSKVSHEVDWGDIYTNKDNWNVVCRAIEILRVQFTDMIKSLGDINVGSIQVVATHNENRDGLLCTLNYKK